MSLASALNPPTAAAGAPSVRTGVVVASPAPTAATAWVMIDQNGEAFQMPYQAPYVPVAGDLVNVLMVGADAKSAIILGPKAGQAGNMVANGNFYRSAALDFPPVNAPPYHWFRHVASGAAAVVCQTPHFSYHRLMMVFSAVGGVSSGDTYAYSSAIPVTAGATYNLRTLAQISTAVSTTVTAQSRIAWFSTAEAVYPNFLSENQFGSDVVPAGSNNGLYHAGSVAAPPSAAFARIALRADHVGSAVGSGSSSYWSEVVMLRA